MLRRLYAIAAEGTDPYENLALEAYLLERVQPGECILYLWQNQRTVVIGRNQHASNECRIQALEADGGHLVRRLSGGGAVYHDLGNLNFTFLTVRRDYDVARQTETILQAVRALGIPAEKNGRNDLTAAGGKFSGHAYYQTGEQCYHHGTLMVSVDLSPLAAYLQVSPLKLEAKGVKSVRARVVNLTQFRPELTVAQLRQALVEAFGRVWSAGPSPSDRSAGRPGPGPGTSPVCRPGLGLWRQPPPGGEPGGPVYLGTAAPGLQPGGGEYHPGGSLVGRAGGGLFKPSPRRASGLPPAAGGGSGAAHGPKGGRKDTGGRHPDTAHGGGIT